MSVLDELREAFAPSVAAERLYETSEPGVTDQPCSCCGNTWYCARGADGDIYCDICLGRGHDEPEESPEPPGEAA